MAGAKSFDQVSKDFVEQVDSMTETQEGLIEDLKEFDSLTNPEQEQLNADVQNALIPTTPQNEITREDVDNQFDNMGMILVFVSIIAAIFAMKMFKKYKVEKRAAKRRTEELVLTHSDAYAKELASVTSNAVTEQLELEIALQEQKLKELRMKTFKK